jgi:hypothetical protein
MTRTERWLPCALTLAIAAAAAVPASASTLARRSLDDPVAYNGLIVLGDVVETHSFWNRDGSFILTEARVVTHEVLKGKLERQEITVTLPGGTVGELTAAIVGGARLEAGRSYLLFLNRKSFLGAKDVLAVGDLAQGVFEVVAAPGGERTLSQAHAQELVPDLFGERAALGGSQGLPLEALRKSIHDLASRLLETRKEGTR